MILIIRGHIRNSFDDDKLYHFVKNLSELDSNLKIYIHTWHIFQSSLSYRHMIENNTPVTDTLILDYFKDLNTLIKKIIIDNDQEIKLVGDVGGRVSNSLCPRIAWKNYFYGKLKISEYIKQTVNELETNDLVINMRFDIRSCPFGIDPFELLEFTKSHIGIKLEKNVFFHNRLVCGLDNFYLGSIDTILKLSHHFHHNLHIIEQKHRTGHQEFMVMWENNDMDFSSYQV